MLSIFRPGTCFYVLLSCLPDLLQYAFEVKRFSTVQIYMLAFVSCPFSGAGSFALDFDLSYYHVFLPRDPL
jgi:hypothetical protein